MREGISPLHLPSEHTPQRKSRGKDQMAVKTNTLFLSPSQSAYPQTLRHGYIVPFGILHPRSYKFNCEGFEGFARLLGKDQRPSHRHLGVVSSLGC